jgi:hypothetical protein
LVATEIIQEQVGGNNVAAAFAADQVGSPADVDVIGALPTEISIISGFSVNDIAARAGADPVVAVAEIHLAGDRDALEIDVIVATAGVDDDLLNLCARERGDELVIRLTEGSESGVAVRRPRTAGQ